MIDIFSVKSTKNLVLCRHAEIIHWIHFDLNILKYIFSLLSIIYSYHVNSLSRRIFEIIFQSITGVIPNSIIS